MQSLARAAASRGEAGVPLPPVFPSLEARDVRIYRGQLCMIAGPGGAGKSMLASNLIVRMQVPTLALILDQDRLTAVARLAAVVTGKRFLDIKDTIDEHTEILLDDCKHIVAAFKAETMDDIKLQLAAYEQRYGEYPVCLLVDNLGNMTSGFENEHAIAKALTLELDELAR